MTMRTFELDDGETLPLTVIVDSDGFHITQTDNMGIEDHLSLSWAHLMGLFELTEKMESQFHVRH
jgi:hypothetical protein